MEKIWKKTTFVNDNEPALSADLLNEKEDAIDKMDNRILELYKGGGGGVSSSWDSVTDKPFETLGEGLNVDENGVLSVIGSVGSLVIDTLFDEVIDSTGTYTLTKSIDDYDFLIASAWGWSSSNTYEQSNYIVIPKKDYYIRSTEGVGWAFCINTSYNGSRRCIFQFDDDTTLNVVYQDISKFRALYGVKIGSQGGSGESVNELKNRIEKLENKLPFSLGIDENGNCGFIKPGEDTVTPFGSGGGGASRTVGTIENLQMATVTGLTSEVTVEPVTE